VSYGYLWVAETVFSSIKRTFGEYITARKFHNMVKEILLKAALYNMLNRDAHRIDQDGQGQGLTVIPDGGIRRVG
jgi:hypothetical protein